MKPWIRICASAAVLTAALLLAPDTHAQSPGSIQNRAESIKNEIMPRVSELRGLEFTGDVKIKVVSHREVRAYAGKAYDEEVTPDEALAAERILTYMGLLAPGTDLRETLLAAHEQQVSGFYDPKEKTLYLVVDSQTPREVEPMTIAHELTHALQDQHYDLDRLIKCAKGNDDLGLAIMSVAEGDAVDVMMRYAAKFQPRGQGPPMDFAPFIAFSTGSESLASLPMCVAQNLTFPYTCGSRFVAEVIKTGGVKAVDAAFVTPPLSTEQVMNFRKFAGKDEPYIVDLPDLSPELGKGWRQLDQMPLGQFNLGLYLANSIGSWGIDEVIEPWKGDSVAGYSGPAPDDFVFVYCSTWDSESAAAKFAGMYRRLIETRFPDAEVRTDTVRGVTWRRGQLLYCLRTLGADVVSVENLPIGAAAEVMARTGTVRKAPVTVAHPTPDAVRTRPTDGD